MMGYLFGDILLFLGIKIKLYIIEETQGAPLLSSYKKDIAGSFI